MVVYECPRCGYMTRLLPNLRTHFDRKTLCPSVKQELSVDELLQFYDTIIETKTQPKVYKCEHCQDSFKTPQQKYKHKVKCKATVSTTSNNEITLLRQEIQELKQHIVSSQNPSVVNNYNNIGTINNYVVNVKAFGHENLSHFERHKEFLTNCLFQKDIPTLVQNIHGDTDYPENQNIRIYSHKKELIEFMSDNNTWLVAPKDEALGELINNAYRILRKHGYFNKKQIMDDGEYNINDYHEVMQWLEEVYDNEDVRKPIKAKLYVLLMNIERILKTRQAKEITT